MRLPNLSERAIIVKVGLACPPVGKTEDPTINKFVVPKTLQFLSTTPLFLKNSF